MFVPGGFTGSRVRAEVGTPISFARRLAASEAFKALFREGMAAVEESAAYLDGPGRDQSRKLRRPAALAYASESMRLTTRLMQVASWLLLQRAVNEGELSPSQALNEKHRVKLTRQEQACDTEMLLELPLEFQSLCRKSLRLQARVMHLDFSLSPASAGSVFVGAPPLAQQLARLEAAFSA